jgi:hypothetical protein
MIDLRTMEEILCAICMKPYTFTRLSSKVVRANGCSCDVPFDLPEGTVIAGWGGLSLYKPEVAWAGND